jgi:inhibitor of cysteine peptidase
MFVKIANVVILLVVIAVLGACGSLGADPVKLTAQDAGTTLHLKPGETFQIALEGNPTTGYTWEVAPGSGDQVALQGEPEFKADSNALGSGGMMTLQFKAVQQGTAPLKLIYHRTFEPGVAPLQTFEVTVVVD